MALLHVVLSWIPPSIELRCWQFSPSLECVLCLGAGLAAMIVYVYIYVLSGKPLAARHSPGSADHIVALEPNRGISEFDLMTLSTCPPQDNPLHEDRPPRDERNGDCVWSSDSESEAFFGRDRVKRGCANTHDVRTCACAASAARMPATKLAAIASQLLLAGASS